MTYDLRGRAALITGANQGFGLALAKAYVQAGAGVMLCARDAVKLERATREVAAHAASGQIVASHAVDVSVPEQADALIKRTLEIFPQLHVLINNAGVYGPKGLIEDIDWKEWTRAMEINVLGSVYMARSVVPHFKQRHYGKIIQLSGGGATNPLPRISAYAASKAAIVRFAETLAEEGRDHNIDVNAIAPGALNTRMLDEVLEAGPDKVGKDFYNRALKQHTSGGAPLDRGAALAVFLGSAASDGITGKLISAVWDPWEELPARLDEVSASDIYTLRRIVPKDRGKTWGDRA